MRARRRGHDGQVPPTRRPGDLRRARADGPTVLAALPAGRPAGQLREHRRVSGRRSAVHRVQARGDGDRAAPRHRRGHDRLHPELRRLSEAAGGAAGPVPEPARQRLLGDRRRHGHQHAAAQPRRGGRRGRRLHRRPVRGRREAVPASPGPGFPDGRDHPGPLRYPRGVPLGPRANHHASPRPRGGAARRQDRRDRVGAPVRRPQGGRGGRRRKDRRAGQGRRPLGDRDAQGCDQGPVRQGRDAYLHRAEARRDPAGRAQQALQAHGSPEHVRLQRRRSRRRCPEDAVAARADPPLPGPPARRRHPPAQARAEKRRAAGASRPGLSDRAREHRRGDQGDPRRRLDG